MRWICQNRPLPCISTLLARPRVAALNPHHSSAEGLKKARGETNDVIEFVRFKEEIDGQVSASFPGFHQTVFRSVT